ncbi:MAG: hypothetical protein PHV37_06500 [Candidatus Gastranaerophilales bacterium]|nr:hypothetical protein [Candidatus Gastranaerophilales bacterium]
MLDLSFSNIVHSNTLNFAILVALIVYVLKKLNVADAVENLRTKIETGIKLSENKKKSAHKNLKSAEIEREALPKELENIENIAKNSLKSLESKILDEATQQIKHIEDGVEKAVDSERNKITSALTKGVSGASIELATKNMKNMLAQDMDLHTKFIMEAIDELDGAGL